MNPAPPTAAKVTSGGRPALAVWHGAWAAAMAVLVLAGRFLPAADLAATDLAALVVLALPGLAGLALRWRDGDGPRGLVLIVWVLAATGAAGLTGGLTGALGATVLAPLAAGVALERRPFLIFGAVGAGVAVVTGLASIWLAGAGTSAPAAAAVIGLVVLIALAWALHLSQSERLSRLDAAEAAAARTETLLAALPALTLVLEPSGRVVAAYGAAPPALPVDPLFDQGLVAAIHAPDRPAVLSALDKALAGQAAQVRFAPRLSLDRRVVMVLRPLIDSSGARRIAALVFDDTVQYAHEVGLETARAEAQAHSDGKTRFLANMSHELRTPLNAVLGFSDMMQQGLFGPLPPKYADYAHSIHEAGGHLLDLINDVLDVAKIEAERYELSLERFDARDVLSAAVALVRPQAADRGVDLAAVLPAEPLTVTADRRALKQIALNLLSNAVKFTPAGGSATLAADAVGPYLEVVVSDTGVGIAPQDLGRLGRPFEQAGGADQKSQGTGLGLSLVRALAELHGGRMTVDSTLGEGTAVTIRLPVVEMTRPAPPPDGAQIIPLTAD
ncbi:MAG TPA: HAMP domain-containing sensor histidine kinase [Brevundimonas sp.]|uniref:sensor histidine kinase n=1 Tax=Brevundimonas sp. TaxID=1871086 RepID=UPI00261FEEFD|nr:HAMP domain-containing sensor histidine kinase [Brevundimonas sp.]HRO33635.1 HAMP domain-containing sensor histidine kinase [Brevundimonas sp.]